MEEKGGSSFTTVVTPEEWARIATPLESDADDPQDFGWHQPDETYLVFFEDELVWSIPGRSSRATRSVIGVRTSGNMPS